MPNIGGIELFGVIVNAIVVAVLVQRETASAGAEARRVHRLLLPAALLRRPGDGHGVARAHARARDGPRAHGPRRVLRRRAQRPRQDRGLLRPVRPGVRGDVQGHRDAGGGPRTRSGTGWRTRDDARAQRGGAAAARRRARGPGPRGAPEAVRGAPQGADRGPPRRQQVGGHRRHQPVRPLRLPSRRHPRGRPEPQQERRQGGRRAPLPRLPHRPGGRRAAVRARPQAPPPAELAQRGRARRARPRRDRRGDGEQRRSPEPRLAQEPQERRQGAAADGRRRLHAPAHPPVQPALQRRYAQQPVPRTCGSTTSTTASTTRLYTARA